MGNMKNTCKCGGKLKATTLLNETEGTWTPTWECLNCEAQYARRERMRKPSAKRMAIDRLFAELTGEVL